MFESAELGHRIGGKDKRRNHVLRAVALGDEVYESADLRLGTLDALATLLLDLYAKRVRLFGYRTIKFS
jgi:hypothetical protein